MAWLRSRRPWYTDGLAFECTGCGGCCSGPNEGYVWVGPEEIRQAARFLNLPAAEFTRRYTRTVGGRVSLIEQSNADCVFLGPPDSAGVRRCVIYSVRPVQCRTWPFWKANLTSPLAWNEAGGRCPGINRGALVPLERIEDGRLRTGL